MSIINIDYLARPIKADKKTSSVDALYMPIVTVKISANHKIYPYSIDCILDSGADFNLLPSFYADQLGLNLSKGEKVMHHGIGNLDIVAYRHKVKLFTGSYGFITTVDFSIDMRYQLLGRYGFFKFFKKLTFDEIKKRLVLKY